MHSTRLEQNFITSRYFDINNMDCCSYNFMLFYQIISHIYSVTFLILLDYLLFIFDECVFQHQILTLYSLKMADINSRNMLE